MMDREEKQRKVKIISLILMCHFLILVKSKPKSVEEVLKFGFENYRWIIELRILLATVRFESGCAIVGNRDKKEVILKKSNL